VTLITKGHVSDEVYEEAKQRFSDEELVNLQTGGRHHQRLESSDDRIQRIAWRVSA
jgi:hypothetical protein